MEPPLTPVPTTNGSTNHDPPAESISTFDPEIFRSYLHAVLPPLFGALPSELESVFDDEFEERVARFAAEGGDVIYVVKVKDEVEGVYESILTTEKCG